MVDSIEDGIEVERRTPFGDNSMVGPKGTRTRRRILESALEVFAEHGYHDSRIEQITEAAGCSRPTFYQYFSSKDAVFRALASFVGDAVVEMIADLGPVEADAAGRAAVAAWMRRFAVFYDTYAPVFTGFAAAARDDPGLPDASADVSAGFGAALRPHLRLGLGGTSAGGPDVDPDVMATLVVTMVLRANLLRLGTQGLVGRRRFVDSLAAVVHRTLVGPVPALDDRATRPVRLPARLRRDIPRLDRGASGARAPSAQGRRTRARIVAAGLEVFPRRGFHETRVDDIVAVAEVSHGSFYRYFDDKDELFRVIAVDAANELIGCIEGFPADGDVPALRAWLTDWFRVYAGHGGVIALWRETQLPDPALDDITHRVADHALGRLLSVLGDRAAGDPLVDAMAFLGLVETVPHHVHRFGYHDEADAVEALVAIIRRGFLGIADGGEAWRGAPAARQGSGRQGVSG